MTKQINPWLDMPVLSQRRVKADTPHDLHWITDMDGKYGFLLQFKEVFKDEKSLVRLKGIHLQKQNLKNNCSGLSMVLIDKEEWQIFYTLCNDLIAVTDNCQSDMSVVNSVEARLMRWQRILMRDNRDEMTLQQQMGLLGELLCIRDYVAPKLNISRAIISWVGAELDKQDFIWENATIEVKAYSTSKGPSILISSAGQLACEKSPFFLMTHSLAQTQKGLSIPEIVDHINSLMHKQNVANKIKNLFDAKLTDYGYIPEISKESFYHFVVNKTRVFLVTKDFPKIEKKDLMRGVIDVSYSVDLTHCNNFEIDPQKFLD